MIKQAALLTLLFLGACSIGRTTRVVGTGSPRVDARSMGSFSAIEFSGAIDGIVEVGGLGEVIVDGDENLLPYLLTEVRGDTLHVRVERGYSLDPMPKVTVHIPNLASLRLKGSGDIAATNADSPELALSIAGSGTMRVEGVCDSLDISISGSGEVHCFDLEADRVDISIAGSGDIEVRAREALAVDISGSGDVRYRGDPSVEKSVAGSGDIRRVE